MKQQRPSFRHLFAFSTWRHGGILALGLASALVVSSLKTALAVILGKVFVAITEFGCGDMSGSETSDIISFWCMILGIAGTLGWLFNFAFRFAWITFGEQQARQIRMQTFSALLGKEMAWFDCQEHGVSSLLLRIQA